MKILLVQPPLDPTTSKLSTLGLAEPLGLEYLAAALPDHDVQILDLRVGGSLSGAMTQLEPRLVGTTAVTAGLPRALEILGSAKQLDPRVVTVIGGHHPTLRPGDCQVDPVDIIVRGDGEQTLAEVAACLEAGRSLAPVTGIVFRRDGQWQANPRRNLPPLDDYAEPARHLTATSRHRYHRVGLGPILSAISSRGCTHRCTFCSIWRFHNGKHRKRSPESVVAELAARPEPTIDFVDDDSFSDVEHMERLRQQVAKELPGKVFRFFVRADTVVEVPDLFERWAETGLRYALVGLESFRDEELRDLNKQATAAQNVQALEILQQAGIGVMGFMIVRPDFVAEDFDRLGDRVEELGILQPVFGTLTPFPGTVLYETMKDRLVTANWEHFDGFRAVVETALPRDEYYHRLANLYRRAYGTSQDGPPKPPDGELPGYELLARAIESLEDEEVRS
jgi:radical SAM superfamily enzyme YgiQ (UPF0313 family)